VQVNGHNIAQLAALEARDLIDVLSQIDHPEAAPILSSLNDGLQNLLTLSLGYLSLDRPTTTLSAGEAQRIKMIRHLGSSLSDLTYIFDEPTIGLHPRDVQGLNHLIRKFRDLGNTVLVVEHDPDVIAIADHVVDLGPGAGTHGGEIVYQGSLPGLMKADTTTGHFLKHTYPMKKSFRMPQGHASILYAKKHNLKDISVDIPTGVLTAVTGVAGAGKSSLMEVLQEQHPDAIYMDQSPLWTSSRSTTATYTGLMDDIRDRFAQANGVSRSLFSFNSTGACPKCGGAGFLSIALPFMDPIKTICEECHGKRYQNEVLQYTLQGKTISAVLDMTVDEALDFFNANPLQSNLAGLEGVGLGYLKLGQPLSSFSGGECQRIKLYKELGRTGKVFVLDEPSVGLHRADLEKIMTLFDRLVNDGNTLILVEHNLDIIKNSDWVIDLGPEAGIDGGRIVFEGTPRQLIDCKHSYTAQALRGHLP
jgi:excinuclease UvrABC ATPase subunit